MPAERGWTAVFVPISVALLHICLCDYHRTIHQALTVKHNFHYIKVAVKHSSILTLNKSKHLNIV